MTAHHCECCRHNEDPKRTVKIVVDEYSLDPRKDYDNLGIMVCWHGRYDLGDELRKDSPDEWREDLAKELDPTVEERIEYWDNGNGWTYLVNKFGLDYNAPKDATNAWREAAKKTEEIVEKALEKHVIMLPLFLYDHSGITMSTAAFSCIWDSGQVGWIYITRERIVAEYGWKVLTKKRIEKIQEYLRNEVGVYDDYLTGAVYGYQVFDDEGEQEDSCYGFFGFDHEKSGLMDNVQQYLDDGYKLEDE